MSTYISRLPPWPRYGYRRLQVLLGREDEHVNHKLVHRIYRDAGLALRRKRRKHCVRVSAPLGVYISANQEWARDFVHHVVASGRTIRVLNVIDAYTRESSAMGGWIRVLRAAPEACARLDHCRTRSAASASLRQWARTYQSALSDLEPATQDQPGAHPTWATHAKRSRGELPRSAA